MQFLHLSLWSSLLSHPDYLCRWGIVPNPWCMDCYCRMPLQLHLEYPTQVQGYLLTLYMPENGSKEPCGWKAAWLVISPSVLFHITWHYPELRRMAETTNPVLNIFSSSCDRILEKKLKNWQWQLAYRPNLQKKDQVWRNTDFFIFFKGKKRDSYDKQAMWTDFLAQWRGKRGGSVGP